MNKRKIGVMVESFRLGVREGIRRAAALGADGIQVYVTRGEITPQALDRAARAEFAEFVADQGLVISALCADYGQGFLDAERNAALVPQTKACIDLAADLGVSVITTHIGKLPESADDPRWGIAHEALSELSRYGDSHGVALATETGPESAEHLLSFLETVPGNGARVNYDPANLCMFGYDPLGGVEVLADYIVHTHAKDGQAGALRETPLGEGDVDIAEWVRRLDAIGYDGFLTIEREVGEDPGKDIAAAVEYLRGL